MIKILVEGKLYLIPVSNVDALTVAVVEAVLWETEFNVTVAAGKLNIPRATLYRKMDEWNIRREAFMVEYRKKLEQAGYKFSEKQ